MNNQSYRDFLNNPYFMYDRRYDVAGLQLQHFQQQPSTSVEENKAEEQKSKKSRVSWTHAQYPLLAFQ